MFEYGGYFAITAHVAQASPVSLVLSPTRELAIQTAKEAMGLVRGGERLGLRVSLLKFFMVCTHSRCVFITRAWIRNCTCRWIGNPSKTAVGQEHQAGRERDGDLRRRVHASADEADREEERGHPLRHARAPRRRN